MKSTLPIVVTFVLVFAFGLMLVAFRSIVIAAKAVLLNLLSVAHGVRRPRDRVPARVRPGPARLRHAYGIDPVVPLLPVRDPVRSLDGLSRLILDGSGEAYDRGASMDDATSYGIKRTAGVVSERG